MKQLRWDLLSVLLPALWILSCCFQCSRAEVGERRCDYIYLLQPPSELPCNPYQPNELTGELQYSTSLQCAVAQTTRTRDDSKIHWIQQTQDSEKRRILKESDGPYKQSPTESDVRGTVIYQSVLKILGHPPPNSSHSYWCKLSTPDNGNATTPDVFANKVTVYGADFYSLLPPCPLDTAFHLAQSVCVQMDFVLDDPVVTIPCSTNSESCSDSSDIGSGSSEDNTTAPANTAVIIVGAGVGGGVVIALVCVGCVLVLCLCKKNNSNERNGPEWGSPVRLNEIVSPVNQTPPSIPRTPSPEQAPDTVVSERAPPLSIPSAVVPQKPRRPPPTLHKPISAQRRGAALLRQLQRPLEITDTKGVDLSATKKEFDGDIQNERGSPARKKPYKSLELNTVDSPHLYMTRAKSPMQTNKPRPRKPPPILQSNPRTTSREKLLLTMTTSNGYIVPSTCLGTEDEEEDDEAGQSYQEIETETQDYLALYTMPQQCSPSTSREEQPIYEEPRPN